jgi:hypothetical protein
LKKKEQRRLVPTLLFLKGICFLVPGKYQGLNFVSVYSAPLY